MTSVRSGFWLVVTVAVMAGAGGAARGADRADRPANAAARGIHEEAVRILDGIRTTKYQHRTEIDEANGVYLCDCSGLVGYILNRTVGADGSGALGDKRQRPLAMHYEKHFAAAPTKPNGDARWQRVERLADARPGDVIAWRKHEPRPGNTGHVVIVDQRPVLEEDALVRVVIIDSTTRPQVDDTRPPGTSGIGRGTMWFQVDEAGRPVATIRGARTAEPKVEPISIGRAIPAKKQKKASQRRAA